MKPNFNFILDFLDSIISKDGLDKDKVKILDFGCGVGEIIQLGISRSLDIYGTDTFDDYYKQWENNLPRDIKKKVLRIEGGIIPFDDNSFDYVITNQVFEHIQEPLQSYKEIHRVLKPKGQLLAIFPNKSVWYEGHVGLYFPHWFKRHSNIQHFYLKLCYFMGFGRKRHMKVNGWMYILNDVTFHHTRRQIKSDIVNTFNTLPISIVDEFMLYRLRNSRLSKFQNIAEFKIIKIIFRFLARIRAGSVIKVKKLG
jgi:SAM-dependent methyltransferase